MVYAESCEKKMWWRSLVLLATQWLFIFCLWVIFRVIPNGKAWLEGKNASSLLEILAAVAVIFVAALLFGPQLRAGWQGFFREERAVRRKKLSWLYLFFLLNFATNAILGNFVSAFVSNMNQASVDMDAQSASPLLFILMVIVAGPVKEELLFRFAAFRWLNCIDRWLAHVVSALLFGLVHVAVYVVLYQAWDQLLVALPYCASGFLFSLYYEKTGNLCYPILLHIANNGVVTLLSYVFG